VKKTKQLFLGLILILSGLGALQAEDCPSNRMEGSVCLPTGFPVEASPIPYQLNLTPGHTKLSHDVHDLHMLILWICVAVGVVVFGVMFYSIYHHRKSKGHEAKQFHENTTVEIIWTIIPAVVLISMAIPATKTMLEMDDVKASDMTIKVTGWQWKWEYDYLDSGIRFFSVLDAASDKARKLNSNIDAHSVEHYLLRVDEPLVVPTKKKIRFVFTAAEVLHSWWVPDLGWKKDAIPGFINEAWASVDDPGIYRGQCTELCGKDHAFMPVVVIAMAQEDYDAWKQHKLDRQKQGSDDSDQSHDELVSKGAEVYAKNCATCHMPDGAGIPGAFPALTKSPVVNGDINAQANVILNGRNAMPAFGKQLGASELAAVITYTRNALGNSKGDEIQPKAIKALLTGGKVPANVNTKTQVKAEKQADKTEAKAVKQVEKASTEEKTNKHAEKAQTKAKAKAIKSEDDQVDSVQFAQDKFYPLKKYTDKPADANEKPATGKSPNTNAGAAKSSPNAKVGLPELVAHGESVYEKNCQSCHQKDGLGMPPMFPALKGNAVVTGKIDGQIDVMLKGKGMMPAFGKTLNAKDFAAVLAFTRNKLGGNKAGDYKQPSEIEKLQLGSK
jgi:cytochrome c oxidase subunit II